MSFHNSIDLCLIAKLRPARFPRLSSFNSADLVIIHRWKYLLIPVGHCFAMVKYCLGLQNPLTTFFNTRLKKKGGIQTREVNNKKAVTSFFTIYTLHRCPKCVDFCNVLIARLLRGIVIL